MTVTLHIIFIFSFIGLFGYRILISQLGHQNLQMDHQIIEKIGLFLLIGTTATGTILVGLHQLQFHSPWIIHTYIATLLLIILHLMQRKKPMIATITTLAVLSVILVSVLRAANPAISTAILTSIMLHMCGAGLFMTAVVYQLKSNVGQLDPQHYKKYNQLLMSSAALSLPSGYLVLSLKNQPIFSWWTLCATSFAGICYLLLIPHQSSKRPYSSVVLSCLVLSLLSLMAHHPS